MTAPTIPTVEDLPLEKLREWPRNPRRISKLRLEQLKRALVAEPEMLQARPLIALPDGTVVAGNQRLRAARVPSEPRSVRGGVYELGAHRLMCGDATSAEDVALLLDGARPEMLFTDPPYGVNYQGDEDPESLRRRGGRGDGRATVGQDALGDDGTRALVGDALTVARDVLAPGGAFYVCSPSGPSELVFRLALTDAGLELRQAIVWAKDVFAFGRQDYHWRHESVLYGWVNGAPHRWLGGRTQDTVWEIPRPKRSELHPTMKPVALIERALVNHSAVDDLVLDPFGGSGSTMIATEVLRRKCAMLELDPAYADVIRQRYADFTNQPELAP